MSITSVVNDLVTSVSVINALKPLPPTISGYSVGGVDDTALDPAGGQTVQINGTGFLAGATITFDGSAVAVVTYVNPNQLTFTSPAKSAGTYTIYAVNPDGGTAIFIPGIIYSVLPTWTTSAGTLGSYYETTSISNTVVASGDAPITYSLSSGSLPTGSTLYANGVITGTAPVDSSSTTYSFTIEAIDAQLQGSTRSFSLTINTDVVTWVSPANATTYTNAVDSAIANVTLSATDAAGYAVSYSANALPTGLSLTGSNISGTPTVIADSSTLLTATAATTNRSATRTINWSITVANDPYFEYNTLLIPGASTTFVDDASTNNFAVSIFGDTKPNNTNPYTPGYYSNYFDGTGDYLQCAYNSAFDLSSSDFTIESWVCTTDASSNYPSIIGRWQSAGNACWDFRPRSTDIGNYFVFIYSTNGTTPVSVNSNTVITDGAWHHLVAVRSGNNFALFVDGIRKQTASFTGVTIFNSVSAPLYVGYDPYGTTYYTGYQSNTRLVKGTAVYDPTLTTLTVPTTPLTAIANTSLLTCQSNRFIDNSTNNFTITVAGNTSISSFDPFVPNSSYSSYGSGYFDGNDYLDVPINSAQFGTGAFTIDFWVYPTTLANSPAIIDFRSSVTAIFGQIYIATNGTVHFYLPVDIATTNTVTVNTWNHVAISRTAGTLKMFINGVSGYSSASTGTYNASAVYIGVSSSGSGGIVGYLSDMRFVIGTGVYTTDFTPPSAPLTAIANTSLLVLQNNQSVNNSVFLDNSTNNFLVTRNGNTTQGTFSPYGGNWSNYFDGTGDYLTLNGTPGTTLTGNFTVEAWVYVINFAASRAIICIGDVFGNPGVMFFIDTAGKLGISYANSRPYTGSGSLTANTWNHVAFVRNSGVITGYINGVSQGTLSTANTFSGTTSYIGLERYNGGAGGVIMFGYISNLRIVNSTAVYTGTFTPPTTPLTPITNTGLLTCADNRLIDDSINNFTITKNGDVSVQRFSPFNPSSVTPTSYSGYFDGTGDYLTATGSTSVSFGTGDFTIEGWFNTAVGTNNGFLQISDTAGGFKTTYVNTIGISLLAGKLNLYGVAGTGYTSTGSSYATSTWTHFALVRSSSVTKLYINGVLDTTIGTSGSITDSTNYSMSYIVIGGYYSTAYLLTGYLSNIRIVKGVAVYTGAFTVPTSPLTATQSSGTNIAAITGTSTSLLTCQSPTFIDNSTNNFTITAVGNSQPTQQNPFGFTSATTNGYTVSTIGGSGYFDGTGDTLSIPAGTYLQFTGNYTIEFWIYFTSVAGTQDLIANYVSNAAPDWTILISPSFQYYPSSAASYVNGPTPVANRWYHVAAVRSGTTCSMYIDGVSVGTPLTFSGTLGDATRPAYIGSRGGSSGFTNGYMSDVRITKSAVYNSNFVPPSAPLLAVQNTVSLLNMTSAGIYDAAMMTNMETVGDAKLSTAINKFGGSSMSFDGTGDWLTLPITPQTSLGPTFTIEAWIYLANTTGTKSIYSHSVAVSGAYGYFIFYIIGTNLGFYVRPSTSAAETGLVAGTLSATTWTHVAVSVNNTACRLFINGTQVGSTTTVSTTTYTPVYSTVGADIGQGYPMNGYIDDLRITKGYARYTANFTPPTSAFPIY